MSHTFLPSSLALTGLSLLFLCWGAGNPVLGYKLTPKGKDQQIKYCSTSGAPYKSSYQYCSDDGDVVECSHLCFNENGIGLINYGDSSTSSELCLCKYSCKAFFDAHEDLKCGSFEEVKAMLAPKVAETTSQPLQGKERNGFVSLPVFIVLIAIIAILFVLLVTALGIYYSRLRAANKGGRTPTTPSGSRITRNGGNHGGTGGDIEMGVMTSGNQAEDTSSVTDDSSHPTVEASHQSGSSDQEEEASPLSPLLPQNAPGPSAGPSGVSSGERLPPQDGGQPDSGNAAGDISHGGPKQPKSLPALVQQRDVKTPRKPHSVPTRADTVVPTSPSDANPPSPLESNESSLALASQRNSIPDVETDGVVDRIDGPLALVNDVDGPSKFLGREPDSFSSSSLP